MKTKNDITIKELENILTNTLNKLAKQDGYFEDNSKNEGE